MTEPKRKYIDIYIEQFGTHEDMGKSYGAWYKYCYRKYRKDDYNKKQRIIYKNRYNTNEEFRKREIKRVSAYIKKRRIERKEKENELKLKLKMKMENENEQELELKIENENIGKIDNCV